jgi:hypothetical protein
VRPGWTQEYEKTDCDNYAQDNRDKEDADRGSFQVQHEVAIPTAPGIVVNVETALKNR